MTKVMLMLTEAEATALRDLLESVSDKGICDKVQRRTVDYVLDEINLVYPKRYTKITLSIAIVASLCPQLRIVNM